MLLLRQFLQNYSIKNRLLKDVYYLIHREGPISKADLLKKTKLKQTTLSRMMEELLSYQFIREVGHAESSGGRPPILYHIQPQAAYIIGIDISRTETRVLLLDLFFRQLDKKTFAIGKEHSPDVVMTQIVETIQRFMNQHQFQESQLLGIGLGTVGPLDRKEGLILNPQSFPGPGWINVPIVRMLSKKIETPILLENGANTAALGEYFHAPENQKNIVYCMIGAGLRCGIITNGKLLLNKSGETSAYGHMVVSMDGRPCICGNKGCLTSYVSFDSLLRQFKARMSQLDENDKWRQNMSIETLIKESKEKNYIAEEIILESARYLGVGIANIVNLIHPQLIILGGKLVYEHPTFFQKVVDTSLPNIFQYKKTSPTFSQGVLKVNAAAVGAGIQVFEHYFDPT